MATTKRAAEDEIPQGAEPPELKKPASADDKFLEIIESHVRKHDIECCMGPVKIHWAMWTPLYYEALERREKRGAPMLNSPLITLCETFAGNLVSHYIGSFELQLVLHTLIYNTFNMSSKAAIARVTSALEEIRDKCVLGDKNKERWFKIMNEVINRYNFKYTPLIEDRLAYQSGQPIGITPSDW
jgi:hypothetical protein